ncbi:MAG: HNH endonuclease [Micavibrio sp.]|nr:HNH endonuclease [Micavibrio sp.]|tara:strand:+ start:3286 stop:3951 length:666 start_codon:yes stop_codon:yes gene_type:complete
MNLENYIESLPTKRKLSGAKHTILTLLWSSSAEFPRRWVRSSELLNATGQKYFDRRARELRDEIGCDLESKYVEEFKEHAWRLNSNKLLKANPREYLTSADKKRLFEKHNFVCATCGKKIDAGVRGLQADHKIPLSRSGSHKLSNWQPICNNCNVGKRRACEGCNDECISCSWAFPEEVGINTVVNLPPEILSKLNKMSGGSQKELNELIKRAIQEAIGNS